MSIWKSRTSPWPTTDAAGISLLQSLGKVSGTIERGGGRRAETRRHFRSSPLIKSLQQTTQILTSKTALSLLTLVDVDFVLYPDSDKEMRSLEDNVT